MHNVNVVPEEMAWEVLLQISEQTGEDLWRTDVPGVGPEMRAMFSTRNYAHENYCQPERDLEDDFQNNF